VQTFLKRSWHVGACKTIIFQIIILLETLPPPVLPLQPNGCPLFHPKIDIPVF